MTSSSSDYESPHLVEEIERLNEGLNAEKATRKAERERLTKENEETRASFERMMEILMRTFSD